MTKNRRSARELRQQQPRARERTGPARPRRAARWEWQVIGVILLVGLGLRVAYLREVRQRPDFDSPISDAGYNDYWARGLATGDWKPPGTEPDPLISSTPYFRPPGYVYFLALIYRVAGLGYVAPRVAQMALGLASCLLAWRLGRRVLNPVGALIAAALMATYWAFIYFEGELNEPPLLAFLTVLLIWVLARWTVAPGYMLAGAAGVLLGVVAVIRPNVLLFVPVVLVWTGWVLWRRGTLRRWVGAAVTLVVGTAVMIAPVTIRNYVVGKDFVLISSNGGVNLYIGNNEYTSLVTPRIPDIERLAGRTGWSLFAYPQIVQGVEKELGRPLRHSEVSKYFADRAWSFIRQQPGTALKYALQRAALLWGPHEVSNEKVLYYERLYSPVLRLLPRFPLVASGFVLGLVLWVWDYRRQSGPGQQDTTAPPHVVEQHARLEIVVLMLLLVGVYFASFLPFLVAGRFRVPYLPLLALFAAYAVQRLVDWIRSRRWTPAGIGVAAWGGLGVLAVQALVAYEPERVSWHMDRASAYLQKGQFAEAIAEYREGIKAKPGFPLVYSDLGATLAREGRFEEAIDAFRQAIKLNPQVPEVRRKLAAMLLDLERPAEAAEEFKAALQLSPDQADTWYKLGRALMKLRDWPGAREAFAQAAERDPKLAEARVNLGLALHEQGDDEGALQELQRALDVNPNLFEAHYNLGIIHAQRGEVDEAIAALQMALHIRQERAAVDALRALQDMKRRRPEAGGAGGSDRPQP